MPVTAFLLQIIESLQDNAFSMSEPISDIRQVAPRGVGTHEISPLCLHAEEIEPTLFRQQVYTQLTS
jgi:hypothetical protein